MPEDVLRQAAAEMLDWHGSGMSVMEMSHRGKEFISICEQAEADLRELLAVPSNYRVLFMQGGGLAENAIVPMNLAGLRPSQAIDFVVTGSWSQKSAKEGQKYGNALVAASGADNGFTSIPDTASWQLRNDASYVHLCSNETIHGVEFQELPDLRALGCDTPLVIDFSSHVLSRAVDWSRQTCTLHIGAEVSHFTGTHSLGDPHWLLPQWLRHATRDGAVLPAGTVVTTGTWCGLPLAQPGDLVVAVFPGIGEARVQL